MGKQTNKKNLKKRGKHEAWEYHLIKSRHESWCLKSLVSLIQVKQKAELIQVLYK